MNCHQCDSAKDLSPQEMDSQGTITFICKLCVKAKVIKRKLKKPSEAAFDMKEWAAMAKESNHQLSLKYRDEAFMKAKGLL